MPISGAESVMCHSPDNLDGMALAAWCKRRNPATIG
jgi:hypothetical protein